MRFQRKNALQGHSIKHIKHHNKEKWGNVKKSFVHPSLGMLRM